MVNISNFSKLNKLKIGIFLLLAFFLPINQKISTILIFPLILLSFIGFSKKKINFNKGLFMPIFIYLSYTLSLLYSFENEISVVEQKASLIAFPVIFILDKDLNEYISDVFKMFVVGCIVGLGLCELNAFYNSFDIDGLTFNSKINQGETFIESLSKNTNFFFGKPFSFIHQTVYQGMYLALAIAIMFNFKMFNFKYRCLIVFFFLVGIVQILNKATLIIIVILFIILILHKVKKRKAQVSLVLFISLLGLLIFYLNPRLKTFNTGFIYKAPEKLIENVESIPNTNPVIVNTRILLWLSAIEIIQKNPLLGIGAGSSDKKLYEVFAIKKQFYDKNYQVHAHNQYLQILMDTGILGFIPFFLLFINLFRALARTQKYNLLIVSFILIISVNFLFDSMFQRYSGISIITLFYCMIITLEDKYFETRKTLRLMYLLK